MYLTIFILGLVGTSTATRNSNKRKKLDNQKKEEASAKKRARISADKESVDNSNATCTRCNEKGHKSSKSPLCRNKKKNKTQQIKDLLGNHESVTRKIKLETIVREQHAERLTQNIVEMSAFIRNVMVRAQIFVN
jgi:hypothetical protein